MHHEDIRLPRWRSPGSRRLGSAHSLDGGDTLKSSRSNVPALVSAVAFAGFSAAHLVDEFVWGAPAEFHLAEDVTEILVLASMVALMGLIAAGATGRRAGYLGR